MKINMLQTHKALATLSKQPTIAPIMAPPNAGVKLRPHWRKFAGKSLNLIGLHPSS
jgi:hypothetical protein